MELAANCHNVDSAKQLAPNTEFDEGLEPTWFQKVCIWFNGIPNWAKVLIGGGLLIASIFINWPVMGLGLGFAAIYSLLQLTLGVGLGVLGYTLNGLFSGNWSVDSLQTELANSIFFVGVTVFISSVCSAIKYAARSRASANLDKPTPDLGNKLDYAFGKATGNKHNLDRSMGMLRELEQIGIRDNDIGRNILRNNLIRSYYTSNNILGPGKVAGTIIKESLLTGPYGFLLVHSIWEDNHLITMFFLR